MSTMNPIVHFEIPYDDPKRATRFYKAAFGWDVNEIPGMSYHMATTTPSSEKGPKEPGAINGGFYPRKGSDAPNPVLVVNVADIEKHRALVAKAGGKVVTETVKVGDFGLYARFTDPEGNLLGLWQDLKK